MPTCDSRGGALEKSIVFVVGLQLRLWIRSDGGRKDARTCKLLEDASNDHHALLALGIMHTHTRTIHAHMHKHAFHACAYPHRETNIT